MLPSTFSVFAVTFPPVKVAAVVSPAVLFTVMSFPAAIVPVPPNSYTPPVTAIAAGFTSPDTTTEGAPEASNVTASPFQKSE